ncbi:MAG: precorrin-6y C5,15-methyltransferase (decarboxylating) subunit CbiE [Candidatus Puniceispirillales bacterium WSBS_2018_MAG_OTU23]
MARLRVIGLTPSGITAFDQATLDEICSADLVIGSDNILMAVKGLDGFGGSVKAWPSPFLDIIPLLKEYGRDKSVVILATGDPLWFGAASTLVRYFSPDDMEITPAPSGFQWAASRMGWPLHTTRTMTVHGRAHETVLKFLAPSARLIVLAHDRHSPQKLANLLDAAGYGGAVMTMLGNIGGGEETRHSAAASAWQNQPIAISDFHVPDFHVIAIACPDAVDGFLPLTAGLDDAAYVSDGQLTKSEVRAITLAKLKPQDGGVLWDIGCGSGAVGIEWMRAGMNARAIGIDNRQDRLDVAHANAARLGVPAWQGLCDTVPKNPDDLWLRELPCPDAVFIGGGLSLGLVDVVMGRLKLGGRIVVNAVTLESEAMLLSLWQSRGGELSRIAIARAEPIGEFNGWRPLMPVTQWTLTKPSTNFDKDIR